MFRSARRVKRSADPRAGRFEGLSQRTLGGQISVAAQPSLPGFMSCLYSATAALFSELSAPRFGSICTPAATSDQSVGPNAGQRYAKPRNLAAPKFIDPRHPWSTAQVRASLFVSSVSHRFRNSPSLAAADPCGDDRAQLRCPDHLVHHVRDSLRSGAIALIGLLLACSH